ncbi:cation:proton antiporter [Pannonibacter tanglangensis]|uniref:Cyclic nucleotide-binding domain-containing protein n=1 Tax=Pannonibacter tanglangensis TaxID=2750084 RepID=A0ABW9ZDS5_9HYPH|nr:cation:proton antiporter [Pannonibacter sp. XCT-34]NBN62989.1 cyclic nucleotide-binding domain-containing protein [Pannonibacter sp. XCT-34]
MHTPVVIAAFAVLLIVIALLQPLARRLDLAPSVLLAAVGALLGAMAAWLLYTPQTDALNALAQVFVDPPIDSETILYVFLPLLLFQTTLTLEMRRIFEDIGPILVLAVVAVLVATAFIGFALYPLAGVSLVACLLLGAIVATTDPVAVVSIFRDIGAPARLGRLVEGESLLNDAAAIVLFVILFGMLTGAQAPEASAALLTFLRSFIGGLAFGLLAGRLAVGVLPMMRDHKLAQVTFSVALPYLVYVLSEQVIGVSAVVAVVSSGIMFNLYGPARVTPDAWSYLHDVWEQIAFWASSLIFIIASILIPEMLDGFRLLDALLLVVLILAAFVGRAVVIFGLLPLLGVMRLGERVNTKYKTVILWGGMRGAVTLTLALSVTEHRNIPEDVQHFVAVQATGFVLFTLLVYGTTLKPLIKLLKLNNLSPLDEALRNQFQALVLSDVRDSVDQMASAYAISPDVTQKVRAGYDARTAEVAAANAIAEDIMDKERVQLGLIALADRERVLVLHHFRENTVSNRTISAHLAIVGEIADTARTRGRAGYNRAARRIVAFDAGFRFAQWVFRRLRTDALLGRAVADRFERLLLTRIVLNELILFNVKRIRPMVGDRVSMILHETLEGRKDDVLQQLDALRLQYPDYADALELEFLRRTGERMEETAYAEAFAQRLIASELYNDLKRELAVKMGETRQRPHIDLGLKKQDLIASNPLFATLPDSQRERISRLLQPVFVLPGEHVIRKGEKGDAAYFISSGAAEVRTAFGVHRMGRGDVVGEMALLTGQPRSADVVALGYCTLLVLSAADFRNLIRTSPELKAHVEHLAQTRLGLNAAEAAAFAEKAAHEALEAAHEGAGGTPPAVAPSPQA